MTRYLIIGGFVALAILVYYRTKPAAAAGNWYDGYYEDGCIGHASYWSEPHGV